MASSNIRMSLRPRFMEGSSPYAADLHVIDLASEPTSWCCLCLLMDLTIGQLMPKNKSEDPPTFAPGTEISAKFRGAFCEAKIKDVSRSLKCKVTFKDACLVVDESQIRGEVRVGAAIEFFHPDTKDTVSGTIQSIKDCSSYTVVFDDGDERVLRRTQICLKGKKHFEQCQTLNAVPLTNPEEFSSPVITDSIKKASGSAASLNDDDDEGSSSSADNDSSPMTSAKGSSLKSGSASKSHLSKPTAGRPPKVRHQIGDVVRVMETSKGFKSSSSASSGVAGLGSGSTSSSPAAAPLRASKTGGCSASCSWYPALVVNPKCQRNTRFKQNQALLVKSFKDGKLYVVMKNWLKKFDVSAVKRMNLTSLKQAVNRALTYLENDELPASWNRTSLIGASTKDTNESSDNDSELGAASSEKRDRFVAQLYKFMDERGTPINKCPMIAGQDLDLYALYKAVKDLGGYARVSNKNLWKDVLEQMKYKKVHGATVQAVKCAFNRYLASFESFYRKLGYGLEDYSCHTGSKLMQRAEKAFRKELAKNRQSLESSAPPTKVSKVHANVRRGSNKAKTPAVSQPPVAVPAVVVESSRGPTEKVLHIKSEEPVSLSEQTTKQVVETQSLKADKNPGVKYAQLKSGMRIRVQYGTGSQRKFYEAKVLRIDPLKRCLVHYAGWNTRYDEVIPFSRIVAIISDAGGADTSKSRTNSVSSMSPAPSISESGAENASTGESFLSKATVSPVTSTADRSRQSSGGSTISLPVIHDKPRRKRSTSKVSDAQTSETKKSVVVGAQPHERPIYENEKVSVKLEEPEAVHSALDDSETRHVIMQMLKDLADRTDIAIKAEPPPVIDDAIRVEEVPLAILVKEEIEQVDEEVKESRPLESIEQSTEMLEELNDERIPFLQLMTTVVKQEPNDEFVKQHEVEKAELTSQQDFVDQISESSPPLVEEYHSVDVDKLPADVPTSVCNNSKKDYHFTSEIISESPLRGIDAVVEASALVETADAEPNIGCSFILACLAKKEEEEAARQLHLNQEAASSVISSLLSSLEAMEQAEKTEDNDYQKLHSTHLAGRTKLGMRSRRRNYSYCTEQKKPSKICRFGDSDNELTTSGQSPLQQSFKDSVSLQTLRQRVTQMVSSPDYKPYYTFNVIDETLPREKKVAIIEERLVCIKRLYAKLRRELAVIERRRRKILIQRKLACRTGETCDISDDQYVQSDPEEDAQEATSTEV